MPEYRTAKIVATGYYQVNMDDALNDYGTVEPKAMLDIDKSQVDGYTALDLLGAEDVTLEITWEN